MNRFLAFLPSRDSLFWTIGAIGGFCAALMGHFDMFPWITPDWQHRIEIAAFAYTYFSGKMATSPIKS